MIKTIGIFPNPTKKGWIEITEKIAGFLHERGKRVAMDPGFIAEHPPGKAKVDCPLDEADMMISLGGDGTLLNLVGNVKNNDLPIMGVNLGRVGFLTEFTTDTLFDALEKILKGDFKTQKRIALRSVVKRNGKTAAEQTAFNDVVLSHEKLARLLTITIFLDEEFVTTYQADGLIISTPTGSTAYSLSAGGPIVEPTLNGILLTPICPHTITIRPVVVPGDRKIRVVLQEPGREATMTIDGQVGIPIKKGDVIEVSQSPKPISLITCPSTSFFEILRKKLGWNS